MFRWRRAPVPRWSRIVRRRVARLRDVGLAAVGDLGPEDDEGDLVLVGHVRGGRGRRVDAGEEAAVGPCSRRSRSRTSSSDVVVALLGGAVGGEPVDRGLGAEPVAARVVVEVGRAVRQPPEGIAERRHRLARDAPSPSWIRRSSMPRVAAFAVGAEPM